MASTNASQVLTLACLLVPVTILAHPVPYDPHHVHHEHHTFITQELAERPKRAASFDFFGAIKNVSEIHFAVADVCDAIDSVSACVIVDWEGVSLICGRTVGQLVDEDDRRREAGHHRERLRHSLRQPNELMSAIRLFLGEGL